eukprot:9353227-Alexandrium_andersonii.AAC.1
MSASLVGSEMCIRDSMRSLTYPAIQPSGQNQRLPAGAPPPPAPPRDAPPALPPARFAITNG